MNHWNRTLKRIFLYVLGLFFMSIGISMSIQAGFGVSPVSSLAYASTLTIGLSIGVTMALANVLYIIIQVILSKRMELNEFVSQFIISFLFGFFMDATLFLVQLFPAPETLLARSIYLIVSLFVIAVGLMGYTTAKLPLMPYDALTYAISEKFNLKFGKAKNFERFNKHLCSWCTLYNFHSIIRLNRNWHTNCRLFYRQNFRVDDTVLSTTSPTMGI